MTLIKQFIQWLTQLFREPKMEYFSIDDFSGGNNLLLDAKRIKDNQTLRTSNLVPYAKGVLEKKKGSASYAEIGEGQIVATMTANDAPSPVVISSDIAVPASAYKFFDGDTNTYAGIENGEYVKVDLGAGNSETLTGISIFPTYSARLGRLLGAIKTFTLYGSNNDSTWTAILTNQSVLDIDGWQTFNFDVVSAYRYFKIIPSENWSEQYGGAAWVSEIKLLAAPSKINNMAVTQIGSDKYIIAAANYKGAAVNDVIYQSKNGAAFVAMTAATGVDTLTPQSDYTFAINHLGHIYMSNGVDNMQVSTNGEARADVAFTTGSLTPNGKFILWWKDRLWVAGDSTDPHAVFYSDNLDPTTFNPSSVLYCGGKDANDPIMGIIPLTLTSANEGLVDTLAVFRRNSIYVIGFDTAPTYIDQLSGVIGCWDSKSICNTPLGVMFVGKDNVYSLGVSGEPSPIGSAIKPIWDGSNANGRATATSSISAIYFNGFVRFAYPQKDATYNNREYWLDIRDYSNVGWFGDHIGLNINCYAVDGNTIYAGSAINGEVWELEQSSYSNMGGDIHIELKTKQYMLDGSEYTTKIMKRYSFTITPNDESAIPAMTANNATYPFVVSAYSEASAPYAAWKAFDGDTDTKWQSGTDPTDGWIRVDCSENFSLAINKVRIRNDELYGLKTFKIQASDNATLWVDLYSGTCTQDKTWQTFKFDNQTEYRYYQILCLTGQEAASLMIEEIEFIVGSEINAEYVINEVNGSNKDFYLTSEGNAQWGNIKGFFTHSDRGKFVQYIITETSEHNIMFSNGLMSYIKTGRLL